MKRTKPTLAIDASRANALQKTGTEWYAFFLLQELKRIIPADVHVVLYSREALRGGLEALPPNWESRVLGWPPKFLWTQARLSWEMLTRPPDALFVPVHVLPLLLPKRVAVTLHDVAFVTEPEAYSPVERWYQRFAVRFAASHADVIFTVSDFSRREIVSRFGADEKKMTVTHLGFDATAFAGKKDPEVLKKHGISEPYFLFVGRLERKKNIAGIVKAFRKMKSDGGDARLVLAGKRGHGYEEAAAEIAEGIRKGDVTELGYVDVADLPALYVGARAFVFPSHYEGFGIPVLEAFASGTPVIASNGSSLPEVAGNAALYVDPNDIDAIVAAIRRLLVDDNLRESLRQKGCARKDLFSWKQTAEATWNELRKFF